jgi:hypothetical protein
MVRLTEEERLRQERLMIEDTGELSPLIIGGPAPEDEEPTPLRGGGGNIKQSVDELDDVVPNQPPQAVPRQQQQPAQPHQQPKGGDASGEEVGWGDEETMRTGDGLERIRPEKGSGKTVRFALLPYLKARRARIHFVPVGNSKGSRLCLAQGDTPGWCCTRLGEEGRYRVVALALCYTNANPQTGGYPKLPDGSIPPITWKLGYLDLSPSNYGTISQLPDDDASPYDYDYAMSMVNNRYEFRIKTRALWKVDPEVRKAVEEASRRYVADGGVKLGRKLGKKLNLVEWKTMLSGAPSASQANLDDMEEL